MGSSIKELMRKKYERFMVAFSWICVPILFTSSPRWLTLQGVDPCWGVLWLLPWSLNKGKTFGLISGLGTGLFLDSLSLGSFTQIPALMFLGFWWGTLGGQGKIIELSLNLGLLAWIGSLIVGLSILLQNLSLQIFWNSQWFLHWAFHTLIAQSIITGLLAPMVCSWILLAARVKKTKSSTYA